MLIFLSNNYVVCAVNNQIINEDLNTVFQHNVACNHNAGNENYNNEKVFYCSFVWCLHFSSGASQMKLL